MTLLASDLLPGLPSRDTGMTRPEERLHDFLKQDWGRRVRYLPGLLAPPPELLDADELAGLACEPDAEARLVGRRADGTFWQEAGPFDGARFDQLGDRDWTLLVNGVDLHLPGFASLLRTLRFVPAWRIDDAMVSFAAPGGSAGPHYDRYDVFLVQLQGTRRWQLGTAADGPDRPMDPNPDLSLVADFIPEQEILCTPGDVLYVPPGVVHHGIADSACLTLSLGMRAPSTADLLSALALQAAETASSLPAELDPELPARAAVLEQATIERARNLLQGAMEALLQGPEFAHWLGCELTRPTRGMLLAPPEQAINAAALLDAVDQGALIMPAPGVRLLLVQEPGAAPVLCIAGERWPLPDDVDPAVLERALDADNWNAAVVASSPMLKLATALHEDGWLVLEEDA